MLQVRRREGPQHHGVWQNIPVEFNGRDVNVACAVPPLVPDGLTVAVQQYRQSGRMRKVACVGMQLDLDPIGQVTARSVDQHMAVSDHVKPCVSSKEEPACTGQGLRSEERGNTGCGQQQGLDHGCLR